nr:MAG TPA: hypothetical protein [Caudoviricetes sp.]
MSESLDDLLDRVDSRFSITLQTPSNTNETLDKVQHLLEKDPSLYQYILLKESNDTSFKQVLQYEQATTTRTIINHIREMDKKHRETMGAMYTIIENQSKELAGLKRIKYAFFGILGFLVIVGFWGLYVIDNKAGDAVIKFIKAVASAIPFTG